MIVAVTTTCAARALRSPCILLSSHPREARRQTHLAGGELLHHLLYLAELIKELIHVLDGRPAAASNATTPAPIDQRWIASLLESHGLDYCLDAFDFSVIQIGHAAHLFHRAPHAGDHLHD